ncbi:MAG: hypothetical protein SPI03_02280, partial [Campylobacter sputorum]|nr:hypothetical protein [Campylobacter sputorum]
MAKLEVSKSGYGVEVLSYYLWGQKTVPSPNELANNKWIDRKENIILNVSANDYMKYVDKYTSAANFGIFQKFFERLIPVTTPNGETILLNDKYTKTQMESVGAKINSDGYYELNIKQMSKILYNNENMLGDEPATDISHYTLDINSDNYAERAFVFGSTKMTFTTSDVRFLINATTFEPEFIDNLQIKPKNDNFDFEGGGTTAKVANHYLNKITDPSGIGRTVHFNFTDKDSIEHIKISRGEFSKLRTNFRNSEKFEPIDMAKAYERYFSDTIIPSGVIDYLDENNKLVMFDGSGDNSMSGTKAGNLDFNENLLSGIIGINNHYKQHIKNGITYIGGKGSDTITGTEFDDILYSNDKSLKDDNSSDTLQGGKGYDIYYANDKDTITDSVGKGKVYLNNTQSYLKGGRF